MVPLILMLRGVILSVVNRLPMVEFREMLSGLGPSLGPVGAQTYIQSGNAVLLGKPARLEVRVAEELKARFVISVPLFLRRWPG